MAGLDQHKAPDNHGEATAEGDAGPADGEKPVGEHEEDPVREVDDANGPLAELGEVPGHVDVSVVAEDAVAAAGILQHAALTLGEVAGAEVPAAAAEGGGRTLRLGHLKGEDGGGPLLGQGPVGQMPVAELGDAGAGGPQKGGIHGKDAGHGQHGRAPLPQGRHGLPSRGGRGRGGFNVEGRHGTHGGSNANIVLDGKMPKRRRFCAAASARVGGSKLGFFFSIPVLRSMDTESYGGIDIY